MSSGCSNSRSSTSVAACENREKLTPFGNVVTPTGCAEPGSVSNGTMPCHLSTNVTTRSSELTTGEGRLFDAARQRLERKHQLEMAAAKRGYADGSGVLRTVELFEVAFPPTRIRQCVIRTSSLVGHRTRAVRCLRWKVVQW